MASKEKRITLFADSLALPRGETWGNIPLEKTYPYLLEKKLRETEDYRDFIFINRAQRFRTIVKTENEFSDFAELHKADIAIIHCGIVDCAPRVFTESQRKWIEKLPKTFQRPILMPARIFRKTIIQHVRKGNNYVSQDDFRKSLENVLQKSKSIGMKTIIVNIIRPPDELERRSPNFQKNADSYNKIIQDMAENYEATLIDLDRWIHKNGGHDKLTSDGMHINEAGHAFMNEQLIEAIQKS